MIIKLRKNAIIATDSNRSASVACVATVSVHNTGPPRKVWPAWQCPAQDNPGLPSEAADPRATPVYQICASCTASAADLRRLTAKPE